MKNAPKHNYDDSLTLDASKIPFETLEHYYGRSFAEKAKYGKFQDVKPDKGIIQSGIDAYKVGLLQMQSSLNWRDAKFGKISSKQASKWDEEYNKDIRELSPGADSTFLGRAAFNAVSMAPMMVSAGKYGAVTGLTGAAMAQIASAGAMPLTIAEPYEEIAAFGAGMTMGSFERWREFAEGDIYKACINNGVSEDKAATISGIAAPLYAAVEMVQVKTALKPITNAARKNIIQGIKQNGLRAALRYSGQAGADYIKAVAKEDLEEGIQKAIEESSVMFGQMSENLISAEDMPAESARILKDSVIEMKDTLAPLMIMTLPGGIAGAKGHIINKMKARQKIRTAISDVALAHGTTKRQSRFVINDVLNKLQQETESGTMEFENEFAVNKFLVKEAANTAKAIRFLSPEAIKSGMFHLGVEQVEGKEGEWVITNPVTKKKYLLRKSKGAIEKEQQERAQGQDIHPAKFRAKEFMDTPGKYKSGEAEYDVDGIITYDGHIANERSLAHELVHGYMDSADPMVKDGLLKAYGSEEKLAEAFEKRVQDISDEKNILRNKIADTFAYLDTVARGPKASMESKKRMAMRELEYQTGIRTKRGFMGRGLEFIDWQENSSGKADRSSVVKKAKKAGNKVKSFLTKDKNKQQNEEKLTADEIEEYIDELGELVANKENMTAEEFESKKNEVIGKLKNTHDTKGKSTKSQNADIKEANVDTADISDTDVVFGKAKEKGYYVFGKYDFDEKVVGKEKVEANKKLGKMLGELGFTARWIGEEPEKSDGARHQRLLVHSPDMDHVAIMDSEIEPHRAEKTKDRPFLKKNKKPLTGDQQKQIDKINQEKLEKSEEETELSSEPSTERVSARKSFDGTKKFFMEDYGFTENQAESLIERVKVKIASEHGQNWQRDMHPNEIQKVIARVAAEVAHESPQYSVTNRGGETDLKATGKRGEAAKQLFIKESKQSVKRDIVEIKKKAAAKAQEKKKKEIRKRKGNKGKRFNKFTKEERKEVFDAGRQAAKDAHAQFKIEAAESIEQRKQVEKHNDKPRGKTVRIGDNPLFEEKGKETIVNLDALTDLLVALGFERRNSKHYTSDSSNPANRMSDDYDAASAAQLDIETTEFFEATHKLGTNDTNSGMQVIRTDMSAEEIVDLIKSRVAREFNPRDRFTSFHKPSYRYDEKTGEKIDEAEPDKPVDSSANKGAYFSFKGFEGKHQQWNEYEDKFGEIKETFIREAKEVIGSQIHNLDSARAQEIAMLNALLEDENFMFDPAESAIAKEEMARKTGDNFRPDFFAQQMENDITRGQVTTETDLEAMDKIATGQQLNELKRRLKTEPFEGTSDKAAIQRELIGPIDKKLAAGDIEGAENAIHSAIAEQLVRWKTQERLAKKEVLKGKMASDLDLHRSGDQYQTVKASEVDTKNDMSPEQLNKLADSMINAEHLWNRYVGLKNIHNHEIVRAIYKMQTQLAKIFPDTSLIGRKLGVKDKNGNPVYYNAKNPELARYSLGAMLYFDSQDHHLSRDQVKQYNNKLTELIDIAKETKEGLDDKAAIRQLDDKINHLSKVVDALGLYDEFEKNESGSKAAQVREIMDSSYKDIAGKWQKRAQRYGIMDGKLPSYQYYIPHLYKAAANVEDEADFDQYTATPFGEHTGRAMKRVYKDGLLEAVTKGKQLRYTDMTANLQKGMEDIQYAIDDKWLLKFGQYTGVLSQYQQPGYKLLNHEAAVDGDSKLYAPEEMADKFNASVAKSKLRNNGIWHKALKVNAVLKMAKLLGSLFHQYAFFRSTVLGGPYKPQDIFRIGDVMREGRQAILNNDSDLRKAVLHGETLFRIQDYDPTIAMKQGCFGKWVNGFDPKGLSGSTKTAYNSLMGTLNRYQQYLFGYCGANLKAACTIREINNQKQRNADKLSQASGTERARLEKGLVYEPVAKLMDNDFGGLNYEKMGWSRTKQDILRMAMLGPDWTISNIRSMIDMFKRGESGHVHRMLWGRVAAKTAVITMLANMIMAPFDPDDDRFSKAWKSGGLKWASIDITPIYRMLGGNNKERRYMSVAGHFEDFLKFLSRNPMDTAYYKASAAARPLFSAVRGKDWAKRPFTSISERSELGNTSYDSKNKGGFIKPSQTLSWAVSNIADAMPIQAKNLAGLLAGEAEGFDVMMEASGLGVKKTYNTKKTFLKKKGT